MWNFKKLIGVLAFSIFMGISTTYAQPGYFWHWLSAGFRGRIGNQENIRP